MSRLAIRDDFWSSRLAVNAGQAIFHQWEQLEAAGCIQNFRIAAGEVEGLREGWFFADSDAYKWLDAASRIWASHPNPKLGELMDGLIDLLGRAMQPDGYLFTYNQVHFPGTRWQNLQIEHELYCHGHLIEAGVSHYEATCRSDLLEIARRAADRIVVDFAGKGPQYTPGHEEIEIALLRLHQVTPGDTAYLNMARQFIEQRGRTPLFLLHFLPQMFRSPRRSRIVSQRKQAYLAAHPDFKPYRLPPDNPAKKPADADLRWILSALSGQYFQQHAPIREQTVPVGHSVRFAYLQTAAAMLSRLGGDRSLLPSLEQVWESMVTKRMYVTGGIGSQPRMEGFGRDYELDPEYAYAETCAALGSLFWNWEMAQLTGQARYSDLFEWQLYNAAAVGMGLDGTSYLYNNPLTCRGGVERRPWYAVPCCPSNLSRTWADLGGYIYSAGPGSLTVHQYIGSRMQNLDIPSPDGATGQISIEMDSDLPWKGRAQLKITACAPASPDQPLALRLRQPSWCPKMKVTVNRIPESGALEAPTESSPTASGYDPRQAAFLTVRRAWAAGDVVEIAFEMPIRLRRAHPRVKGHAGKAAMTRGPLVYCLEDLDNPGLDIFSARLDPASLTPMFEPELLGGTLKLQGKTIEREPLTFIPYLLWGNRGPSKMTVWVNA